MRSPLKPSSNTANIWSRSAPARICHTPGSLLGHPDLTRFLAGSDVGYAIPELGINVPPNLTPDKTTGLGDWTTQQIVTAITTGQRPDGRILAPIMPWQSLSHLTKSDATAIAVYLKSLPPVHNQVPGPFLALRKNPPYSSMSFCRLTFIVVYRKWPAHHRHRQSRCHYGRSARWKRARRRRREAIEVPCALPFAYPPARADEPIIRNHFLLTVASALSRHFRCWLFSTDIAVQANIGF